MKYENNMFENMLSGTKSKSLLMINQVYEAAKDNSVEITNTRLVGAPDAFNSGLTEDKNAAVFAVEIIKGKGNGKVHIPEPAKEEVKHVGIVNESTYGPIKINDRKAETFRQGIEYVCPCKFKTKSLTGFKKHYNRCKKRGD